MRNFKVKWGLAIKTAAIVAVIVAARVLIQALDLDVIAVGTMVSALVTGAVFTVAIIFAGTLTDYKESEKIPGELTSSIMSLYKDAKLACLGQEKIAAEIQSHIKELLRTINSNFSQLQAGRTWKSTAINSAIDKVDEDITHLAEKGVAPVLLARLRTELTNINKMSNRIDVIAETSFIPAAYAIAEVAIIFVLAVSSFVEMEHYYEGVAFLGSISFLLIGLMLLIRDMDNPFEGYARVDLSLLDSLEQRLEGKT
jgi:hypothetical protein